MVQRSLTPLHLPKSPLILVLGQVSFSPIANIKNYVPEIQDIFRKEGFPGLRDPQNSSADPFQEGQWEFYNKENNTSIVLNQNGVTVQTTAYKTYDEFEPVLKFAFETVNTIARISLVHRLGLRYIDLIHPNEDPIFSDYIQVCFLGFPNTEYAARNGSFSETILITGEKRQMALRCVTLSNGLVLPPDLEKCRLGLKETLPQNRILETPFAILDFDHFEQDDHDYFIENIMARMEILHDVLDKSFREVVTEKALKEWSES